MKKVISLICVMLMLVLCFTGCGDKEDKTTSVYETINTLVNKEYLTVNLSVKTTTGDDTLQGTYSIKKQSDFILIEYSHEKLNGFTEVGGVITPPTEEKSTISGTMKVKDGQIIEQNGESTNIALEQLGVSALTFNEVYFTNIQSSDGSFSANVNNVKDFLGFDLVCSDMKIAVNFTAEKITSLTIQYASANSTNVEIIYSMIN